MESCASSWSPWLGIYPWLEPSLCSSFAGRWAPSHKFKDVREPFKFLLDLMHFSWLCARNWTSTGRDWQIFWISLVWGDLIFSKSHTDVSSVGHSHNFAELKLLLWTVFCEEALAWCALAKRHVRSCVFVSVLPSLFVSQLSPLHSSAVPCRTLW